MFGWFTHVQIFKDNLCTKNIKNVFEVEPPLASTQNTAPYSPFTVGMYSKFSEFSLISGLFSSTPLKIIFEISSLEQNL